MHEDYIKLTQYRLPHQRFSQRVIRAAAQLERAIPTAPQIDAFVREQKPDAVLVTSLVKLASPQVEYLKSARRLGIPAATVVASWDNLTNKGLIKVVPDRVRDTLNTIAEGVLVLDTDQRIALVFHLWVYEEKPLRVIGDQLNLSPARVHALLKQTTQLLRSELTLQKWAEHDSNREIAV